MAEFQNALQVALDAKYQDPPWLSKDYRPPQNLSQKAQQAINVYLLSKKPNGEMGGIGWWQSANGYTAMALRDLWIRDRQNYRTLEPILHRCEKTNPGFINAWNDDSLWWALCCVHMYSMGGVSWYLEKAKGVWEHIRKSGSICGRGQVNFQGEDMEGAVYWTTRPGEHHINAISTGLYAELSARLALIHTKWAPQSSLCGLFRRKDSSVDDYIDAARLSLGWILRCRYQPHEGVVLDHIELNPPKAVDWTFTYNTGVTLGTCALLYESTMEESYLTLACHMARKSMTRASWVESNGVLTERGAYGPGTHDPLKNNDAVGFKAVLIRQLCTLYDVIIRTAFSKWHDDALMIKKFINVNLESQLERNTNGRGQYGPWWNGPFDIPTSHSQMAVLDVMAAAMIANRW